MVLEKIEIASIDPCMAGAARIGVKAEFSRNVADILPYLNTVLKHGVYNKFIPSLTFTEGVKLITIFPKEVFIGKLVNQTEAYQTLDRLKSWINETYGRKDEIVPTRELKKRPSAIEIYALLPQKNCRECGEMTCLAFASKVLMGQQKLNNCTHLYNDEEFSKEKIALEGILGYL